MIDPEDISITKRKTAPYYWPDVQSVLQLFLSVSAVALVWYVVQRLLAEGGLKIDQSVRDLVVFILGIIFGCFKDVYGFTFGSSAGQRRQGEVITKSLEDKDKIIAAGVDATAASVITTTDAVLKAAAIPPGGVAAKTVDDHTPKVTNVSWWSLLTDDERTTIDGALADPKVDAFKKLAESGAASAEDLDYLVSQNLLTKARAGELLKA